MFTGKWVLRNGLIGIGTVSLAAWFWVSPDGYLAYTWKWLTHLGKPEVWSTEQEALSRDIILPVLQKWVADLDTPGDRFYPGLHRSGDPLTDERWNRLADYYEQFGISISDRVSYYSQSATPRVKAFVETWAGRYPFKLQELHWNLSEIIDTANFPQNPRVLSIYLISQEPECFIYWPGGSQYARYISGYSPSLEPNDNVGNAWRDVVLARDYTFEPASGDSLGLGDTMISGVSFELNGARVFLGSDVRWEDSPVGKIRGIVILNDLWFFASFGAIAVGGVANGLQRLGRRRASDATCVTVTISRGEKQSDLEKGYLEEDLLARMAHKAFRSSSRQQLLTWPAVGGYHMLFVRGWGADIYEEPLCFAAEMVRIWTSYSKGLEGSVSPRIIIAIGRPGIYRATWVRGHLMLPWDRVLSSAEIAEIAGKHAAQFPARPFLAACDESYFKEARRLIGEDGSGFPFEPGPLIDGGTKSQPKICRVMKYHSSEVDNAMRFDVFLSHNSKDKEQVRKLGFALKERGLLVWLDEWELVPGRSWMDELEKIVASCKSSIVCVGPHGIGPWEQPEMQSLLIRFMNEKQAGGIAPVIPVLLPGAPETVKLPLFLETLSWVDLRGGLTTYGLNRLEWGITGRKVNGDTEEVVAEVDEASPPQSAGASDNTLVLWQRRLEFLQAEEAVASNAAQKFELMIQIESAKAKIAKLSS